MHLKLIEDFLHETLFHPVETLPPASTLMQELNLDQAILPHKAFLLALIKSGKVTPDNMLKVLHETKVACKDFDNECIYCKYSQYALRESGKIAKAPVAVQPQPDVTTVAIPGESPQPPAVSDP
jgi:hypothetical protein